MLARRSEPVLVGPDDFARRAKDWVLGGFCLHSMRADLVALAPNR
jgi:hypothetical protein